MPLTRKTPYAWVCTTPGTRTGTPTRPSAACTLNWDDWPVMQSPVSMVCRIPTIPSCPSWMSLMP
ncbi:MAG: hypothetical protein PHD33_03060 [Atribacterota bacterium]|nr:hypothetical protein [Atribacterota bacterium]